jgi:hypothetical protein
MIAAVRTFIALVFFTLVSVAPASAQVFWLAPDFTGAPLSTYEPGMGVPMPGATPAEQKAAIAWNMRSGLNVAALQCGFEPTLLTLENYNALLSNHNAELATIFNTLTGYFKRVNKVPRVAARALDTFGTKTYSGFSAVSAIRGFCTAASNVGRAGLFTPKGQFAAFAQKHLRELRNGTVFKGEQQFRVFNPALQIGRPRLDETCWKKDRYVRSCGLAY